eukprot:220717_1
MATVAVVYANWITANALLSILYIIASYMILKLLKQTDQNMAKSIKICIVCWLLLSCILQISYVALRIIGLVQQTKSNYRLEIVFYILSINNVILLCGKRILIGLFLKLKLEE